MVTQAAVRQGYHGPIYQNRGLDPTFNPQLNKPSVGDILTNPSSSKEAILSAIRSKGPDSAVMLLREESHSIDKAMEAKAKHTVLNFSQGTGEASTAKVLYRDASLTWDPKASPGLQSQGKHVVNNYAKAFGLDASKLLSTDPKVNAPERARLQQHLLDEVKGSMEGNPRIAAAKATYDQKVHAFTEHQNSVVVSAGNEGDTLSGFRKDNGGQRLHVSPQFFNNVLSNNDTVTVGATRWMNNGREHVANYSNPSSNVSIYAAGGFSTTHKQRADESGTSFAAPEVSAALAGEYKAHPTLNHRQVENLMKHQLTHQLGDVAVLDFGKTDEFLSRQTY